MISQSSFHQGRRLLWMAGLVCAGLFGDARLAGQAVPRQQPKPAESGGQVTVLAHPSKRLFQSEQGKQRPLEVSFEPQTRQVTVRLSVEDPDGYFIPNLHPENFAVYEDTVRQQNATVDIEHTPVTIAVLMEAGGRYQQLNKILSIYLPSIARPLARALLPSDKVAVFSYANTVKTLMDFAPPGPGLEAALGAAPEAGFSETNLYDALDDILNRMAVIGGRRAVVLLSTGADTFSHASFDGVVASAARATTPVYCVVLSELVERDLIGTSGPASKVNWSLFGDRLKMLAQRSGGRAYLRDTDLDIDAIYDDMMEHLRVRYLISYVSSNPDKSRAARTVRVDLVDPRTGGPLRIVDTNGKAITARISLQAAYTP